MALSPHVWIVLTLFILSVDYSRTKSIVSSHAREKRESGCCQDNDGQNHDGGNGGGCCSDNDENNQGGCCQDEDQGGHGGGGCCQDDNQGHGDGGGDCCQHDPSRYKCDKNRGLFCIDAINDQEGFKGPYFAG